MRHWGAPHCSLCNSQCISPSSLLYTLIIVHLRFFLIHLITLLVYNPILKNLLLKNLLFWCLSGLNGSLVGLSKQFIDVTHSLLRAASLLRLVASHFQVFAARINRFRHRILLLLDSFLGSFDTIGCLLRGSHFLSEVVNRLVVVLLQNLLVNAIKCQGTPVLLQLPALSHSLGRRGHAAGRVSAARDSLLD